MNKKPQAARKQRGFTLVEMSVSMAAAGLLFAAVTTGQELVDQAKATKFINDVKAVEAQLQQYAQFKGRLPGDCNRDGVIDYDAGKNSTTSLRADDKNMVRAQEYSYSNLLPTIGDASTGATKVTDGCALVGVSEATTATVYSVKTTDDNANVWLNDLKLGGVVSDSAPNRKLAKMVNEDFLFVGNVADGGTTDAEADPPVTNGPRYNAIVVHNVPQWMARRLANAINGQDARADRTRVRMFDPTMETGSTYGKYAQGWQANATDGTTTRDTRVSVVYFFDRIPSTTAGGV